jgi:hypothetical protein
MTTGLLATVLLTDSSIHELKDESPDEEEEEEALTATALARRPTRKRRGRHSEQCMGRVRVAAGRRQSFRPDSGISAPWWAGISRVSLLRPQTQQPVESSCVCVARAKMGAPVVSRPGLF